MNRLIHSKLLPYVSPSVLEAMHGWVHAKCLDVDTLTDPDKGWDAAALDTYHGLIVDEMMLRWTCHEHLSWPQEHDSFKNAVKICRARSLDAGTLPENNILFVSHACLLLQRGLYVNARIEPTPENLVAELDINEETKAAAALAIFREERARWNCGS